MFDDDDFVETESSVGKVVLVIADVVIEVIVLSVIGLDPKDDVEIIFDRDVAAVAAVNDGVFFELTAIFGVMNVVFAVFDVAEAFWLDQIRDVAESGDFDCVVVVIMLFGVIIDEIVDDFSVINTFEILEAVNVVSDRKTAKLVKVLKKTVVIVVVNDIFGAISVVTDVALNMGIDSDIKIEVG